MIHSFLEELALEVDLVPGLERVTMIGLDLGVRVIFIHSLFSVRVNVYLTQQRLFACLGKLPAKGVPPVANINLAGMNNSCPNLTTFYLDTPLVGLSPEPLEYAPSPGRLRQPSGYPPTSTGAYIGGSRRRPTPPPPLYHTHPRMHPPTDQAQQRRVMQPTTGQESYLEILPQGGNPWKNFGRRVRRGLTPPRTLTGTGGGEDREATGVSAETETVPNIFD